MDKLAMSLLHFKALMNDTINYLGQDDTEILDTAKFELIMSRIDGKSQAITFEMGAEVWDVVENMVTDYVDVLINSYCWFSEDSATERELSIAYGLDYVTIETDYNQASDITYIFEVTYSKGKEVKRTLKGFYYGEPNTEDTSSYYESLTAQFS